MYIIYMLHIGICATHFCKLWCYVRSKRLLSLAHLACLRPDWVLVFLQVAARTETGVRRRTQAMSRSCSKRKSRFSSLWGLDTTSKKKTKAHPSINQVPGVLQLFSSFTMINTAALATQRSIFFSLNTFLSQQVFADGEEPVKKPADGIYVDPAKEHTVRRNHSVCIDLTLRYRSNMSWNIHLSLTPALTSIFSHLYILSKQQGRGPEVTTVTSTQPCWRLSLSFHSF